MKKFLFIILMSVVFLSGCSDNSVESSFFKDAPEKAIALIVNLPTPEQILEYKVSETLYFDETDEKMLFIPRYEHTTIDVYALEYDEEVENLAEKKIYSNTDSKKDFCLEFRAIRPEGIPNYKVSIGLPNGIQKEYIFSYNGKDGNPNMEYILE
ncbi:hypothetical protein [Anaerovorax sp. IOR16]|uniref:hypothetical protein n=1 Tax=Anaerovorax sp. IOR16 TaxID=2773458 RepID=UPI0019D05B17|nr:hypothetical protein [Anaerovorax sp. IOR16]